MHLQMLTSLRNDSFKFKNYKYLIAFEPHKLIYKYLRVDYNQYATLVSSMYNFKDDIENFYCQTQQTNT